jgi:uncharacterized protein
MGSQKSSSGVEENWVEHPVSMATRSGAIHGSLLLPLSRNDVPVVLIVAGSGPTDRDGNSVGAVGQNNSLKLLAWALLEAGFATVRFDKRGVGASISAGATEAELRIDTYVNDTGGWIDMLLQDDRFSGVAVVGHSEGALIGMLACKGRPVKAFISIAGVAQGAASILRLQLQGKLDSRLAERSEAILTALEGGRSVGDVPVELQFLYRTSVQPYLQSWFRYIPADEFRKLEMPCLIIQGDEDVQVPVSEAHALKNAKPEAVLQILSGMNHVLKRVSGDRAQQLASYGDPTLPLAPDLSRHLIRFLSNSIPKSK